MLNESISNLLPDSRAFYLIPDNNIQAEQTLKWVWLKFILGYLQSQNDYGTNIISFTLFVLNFCLVVKNADTC